MDARELCFFEVAFRTHRIGFDQRHYASSGRQISARPEIKVRYATTNRRADF